MLEKDKMGSMPSPFRVGILPVAGFPLMSYACTVEPLRAANLLSQRTLYDIVHFGQAVQTPSSGAATVERVLATGGDGGLHGRDAERQREHVKSPAQSAVCL